jgi:hypothetical protein
MALGGCWWTLRIQDGFTKLLVASRGRWWPQAVAGGLEGLIVALGPRLHKGCKWPGRVANGIWGCQWPKAVAGGFGELNLASWRCLWSWGVKSGLRVMQRPSGCEWL